MKKLDVQLEAEQFLPAVGRTWRKCREFVGDKLWVESKLGLFILTLDGPKELQSHNWIVKEARGNFVIWTEQDMKNILASIENENAVIDSTIGNRASMLASSSGMSSTMSTAVTNGEIRNSDWKGLTGIEKYN